MDFKQYYTPGQWVVRPADYTVDEQTVAGFQITTDYPVIQICSIVPGNNTDRIVLSAQANAERIVKCVNAHDDLVAALKKCERVLGRIAELKKLKPYDEVVKAQKKAQKALNQIEQV